MKKKIRNLFTKVRATLKSSFTLVELIIVIAIIAILAVWVLMLLTKWIGESRDSRRIADLETLSKWLTVYFVDVNGGNWLYPECDNINWTCVNIISWWVVYWKQWEVTIDIAKAAQTSNKVKDPLGINYTYEVSVNRKKFQLLTMLENKKEYIVWLTDNTYALTVDEPKINWFKYPFTKWDKLWILIDTTTLSPIEKISWLTEIDLSNIIVGENKYAAVVSSNEILSWTDVQKIPLFDIPVKKKAVYAILDKTKKWNSIILSDNNLTATNPDGYQEVVLSDIEIWEKKWYWEVTITEWSSLPVIGVMVSSLTNYNSDWPGLHNWYWYCSWWEIRGFGSQLYKWLDTYGEWDIIWVAIDLDNYTIEFFKNWNSIKKFNINSNYYYSAAMWDGSSSNAIKITFNFWQNSFTYQVLSWFNAWLWK